MAAQGVVRSSAIKIKQIVSVFSLAMLSLAAMGSVSLAGASAAVRQAVDLVIIYPEVREPFARVFEEVVRGAEEGYQQNVRRVSMADNQSPVDFVHVLDHNSPVLVLGNRLARQVTEHNAERRLIVGAVNSEYSNVFGITLIPDSEVIAQKLPVLVPAINTVHIVTNAENSLLDFDRATQALSKQGIQLSIHQAKDIRVAAGVYRDLMQTLDESDAVWILPKGSFVNNAVLAILLQESWEKHFVVFSSNPIHVKRGALFSIYPNNYNMGLSLGRLARDVAQNNSPEREMQALEDIFVTLNERTSNHLGINLTDDVRAHIDLILPAR
jgi:putative ABC transport system substrate-binding protein